MYQANYTFKCSNILLSGKRCNKSLLVPCWKTCSTCDKYKKTKKYKKTREQLHAKILNKNK